MFNLSAKDYNKIVKFIKKNNIQILAIQAPEGLKTSIQEIELKIRSNNNILTAIYIEPCYGACDIPDLNLKELEFQGIVHIGHSQYINSTEIPTLYIELYLENNFEPTLKSSLNIFKPYKNIGLITTIQYIKHLDAIEKTLNSNGIKTHIGKPKIAKQDGQILGCDQSAAIVIKDKVDAYLYIGTGRFHPLGVAKATGRPVLLLNPENTKIEEIDKTELDKEEKKIAIKISKFNDATRIGLLVTTKKGQLNRNYAEIKEKLEKIGKEVYILIADNISPEKIEGLKLDFLINTACPRIEEDTIYSQPLINWDKIITEDLIS